ncbi:lipase family protein [Hyalangium versicolor]|uniref:lipase family protein n=1 Tax=Hyalangium versicolor TaxID=2861190 RepID=UPI001CCB12E1|nr:hypothetical protein [Hyalangium versicolor]
MAFTPGFNVLEAQPLLAFCAQIEGTTPGLPPPPIPSNWSVVFDSQQFGPFDNRWQLWKNNTSGSKQYAVVIRGTVALTGSELEDALAVMIPASGTVSALGYELSYSFAADTQAAVHVGFAMGTFLTLLDPTVGILVNLVTHVPSGSDVFITGHSQGAAMATLVRSFLQYSSLLGKFGFTYNYKSYVFAQPKPGNDHYGDDYNAIVSNTGMGFTVNNDQDWVPQVPFTFELLDDINKPNLVSTGGLAAAATSPEILAATEHLRKAQQQQQQAARVRHEPTLQKLGAMLKQQKYVQTRTAADAGTTLKLLPTFNFTACGTPITLQGKPGTNPQNPNDGWWQHHAPLYYELLTQQFPS